MNTWTHYIPIATTIFAAFFAPVLYKHFVRRPDSLHIMWWGIGVITYGLGTLLESLITIFGWNEFLFRSWYIAGALMGGAPLAQGTVYLYLKRKTAHLLTAALVTVIVFGSAMVILTPLDHSLVNPSLPQGKVIMWNWVRLISPFVNTYAFIFLVGGAIYSAIKFRKMPDMRHRVLGNALIAFGAILPGIGGAMSRMGHTQVLYIAEFIGIVLIYWGYCRCLKRAVFSIGTQSITPELRATSGS
jgi:hypothetical protein